MEQQQPPLQVVRAFPTAGGAALVHLHNVSGGVLAGDRLYTSVSVEAQASAQLTTTGATRIYRSREADLFARQTFEATVESGGLLEYLPDQLLPFAGSAYQQRSNIRLNEGAGLLWWDILASGRLARGERFQYRELDLALEIWADAQPIALERFRLEPARRPLDLASRLGSYNYLVTFYACLVGEPAERWLVLERELAPRLAELTRPGQSQWGVSHLAAHGLVVRGLAVSSRDLLPNLYEVWGWLRPRLFGLPCPPPRKVN